MISAVIIIAPFACKSGSGDQITFAHDPHLKSGIECKDCHASGGAMPTVETCKTCHSEAVGELTPEKVEGIMKSLAKEQGAYGLIFDHTKHSGMECKECHTSGSVTNAMPKMDFCMTMCHGEGKDVALSCNKCHATLDAEGKPSDHGPNWQIRHGASAYANAASCKECHQENKCFECHRTSRPNDHNQSWRLRGHGVIAQADRERCMACHTQEYCTRCHMGTKPISHVPSWNNQQRGHCRSCHTPISSNTSCAVCHVRGASHATAPNWTLRVFHASGVNCRACHGSGGGPFNHYDNGDNCESCHGG